MSPLRLRPTILMFFFLFFIIYHFPPFNLIQSLQSFVTSHTCNLNLNVLFPFFNCLLHSFFTLEKFAIAHCFSRFNLRPHNILSFVLFTCCFSPLVLKNGFMCFSNFVMNMNHSRFNEIIGPPVGL
jgi:hypothetical protein